MSTVRTVRGGGNPVRGGAGAPGGLAVHVIGGATGGDVIRGPGNVFLIGGGTVTVDIGALERLEDGGHVVHEGREALHRVR